MAVREAFPDAERIYLAEDDSPVHFHPDGSLSSRNAGACRCRCPRVGPRSRARRPSVWGCRSELLPLPTYAPWTNPIEKLWRLLKTDYLHLHRTADDWAALKRGVRTFLDQFDKP